MRDYTQTDKTEDKQFWSSIERDSAADRKKPKKKQWGHSDEVLEKNFRKLAMNRYDLNLEIQTLKVEETKLRNNIEDLISLAEVIKSNKIFVANSTQDLVKQVAAKIFTSKTFKVTVEGMESRGRKRELIYARKCVFHYLMNNTRKINGAKTTLARVGAIFNRDHATVINALEDYDWLYGNVHDFRLKCDSVKALVEKAENADI